MPDFVKIDRSEVPNDGDRGPNAGRVRALLNGETIWIAGSDRSWVNGASRTLKRKSLRARTKLMIRGGEKGLAVWTEPR